LRTATVTGIQIHVGSLGISATRTNSGWLLNKPFAYPAQTAAIETLLDALAKLSPQRLTAADMLGHKDADYGLENPPFTLDITNSEQTWHLRIGNKTAPGDQVFVRVVGVDGAFIADADWLKYLPRSPDDWRDTALVDAAGSFDWIVITNGTKAIELRSDPTNHFWRMIRPWSARADSARITAALQQLRAARVTKFITDEPHADLSSYGLQPAELDVWLGHGTNFTAAIHAGKSAAEHAGEIYARRDDWNAVVTVAGDSLTPWRGAVNDFRDTHLMELAAPVREIEVRGETNINNYILQQHGSNDWSIVGEKFSADPELVQTFIRLLAGIQVTDFVKDNNTAADLQSFGLATPTRQITLRGAVDDTNSVLAQILFGATETNKVFVKRADEDFVYALAAEDFNRLFLFRGKDDAGYFYRDRRIWNFSETNVVLVTLHQSGKTRQLVRTGANSWTLASSGIINPPAVEETVHRLGELTVAGWLGRGFPVDVGEKNYGLNTNNLQITIELKNGEKRSLDFGTELPASNTAMAAVTLEGERWAFVFWPPLYQLVAAYLTIPPTTP
jgi:hypothetical protein